MSTKWWDDKDWQVEDLEDLELKTEVALQTPTSSNEIKELREEIKKLKEENKEIKLYLEKVKNLLMGRTPEKLDIY